MLLMSRAEEAFGDCVPMPTCANEIVIRQTCRDSRINFFIGADLFGEKFVRAHPLSEDVG